LELFHFIDTLVAVTFVLVQARITQLMVRAASRKYQGTRRRAALLGIAVFDGLLLLGYILSFGNIFSLLRFPRNTGAILSAVTLFYLLLASAVLTLHWLRQLLAKPTGGADPGRRRVLAAAGNAALAVPVAVLGYGSFIERLDFRIREIEVPVPDLPPPLEGLRIVQLTDIHLSPFLSEKQLAGVIDSANELRPHLVAVTGDLVTSHGDPIEAAMRQLARLKSDAGVYGCMGNHDIYSGVTGYVERRGAGLGMRFLRGTAHALRFGSATLNLAGSDYEPKSNRRHYLRGMDRLVRPDAVNFLLQHNPDVFPTAARQGYNLLLAGHTHGGQVTVEIFHRGISPAVFFTPFVYGLYRRGDAAAYVSRGIGTIGIPTRIGAPPEVSLLRLRKAPPALAG
jgi:predicted MPP superfamily phosphohydrolase